MYRLFWLVAGMIIGAAAYRYFREQGGRVAGFETVGDEARRLQERGREFAEAARRLGETARLLADEGRVFAQTAVNSAQSRGREVMENVRGQASLHMREDVRQESGGGTEEP
jgi:hypothetical protein